jgi:hypothetical protein
MTTMLECMAKAAYEARRSDFAVRGYHIVSWAELSPETQMRERARIRAALEEARPFLAAMLESADPSIDEAMAADMVNAWLAMTALEPGPLPPNVKRRAMWPAGNDR